MKVFLVEDEEDILRVLRLYFEAKGHVVETASDGIEAVQQFELVSPDLVLLDIRIPRLSGWHVLESIRSRSEVPIILTTALDSAEDAVRGLTSGADDYLRKPFDFSELEARMYAVLRRSRESSSTGPLQVGSCQIDDRAKVVTLNGAIVPLSPKEYKLLKLLASDPGRVFASKEIIGHLWPPSSHADSNDVKQYVHLLRNKISRDRCHPPWVETVKGFGYKLVAQRPTEF